MKSFHFIHRLSIATLFSLVISVNSCTSVKEIGSLNMISTRNIDTNFHYQLVASYSGGSKKELKKSEAKTIQDAMNNTVRKVPGGEFLMNAKIYLVDKTYFAVEGDVWGTQIATYRGFKVGDKVTWKKTFIVSSFKTGIIQALKDNKTCYIKIDNSDKIVELDYDDITRSEK